MDEFTIDYDKIYALVIYEDDYFYNKGERLLYLFNEEWEYEKFKNQWNELQDHIGCRWRILYKKEK